MPLSVYERAEFLKQSGWSGATAEPIGEDWSQRQYFRIRKGSRSAILVHSVPDNDAKAVAGHKLIDFVEIGRFLGKLEASVPEIYAKDLAQGLMLIEDFGDYDFIKLISEMNGVRQADAYRLATQCLMHLYKNAAYIPFDIIRYEDSHIHKGRQRVVDWYIPSVLKRKNPDDLVAEYLGVWNQIERELPPVVQRFQHGDFHPGNLLYLPDRIGFRQVGMIDFQGGMRGPAPYDLVNLLEDARRMVPEEIKQSCLEMFVSTLNDQERESFLAWYPVLSAQFHFRVIGQAIKLAVCSDITRLMDLMPILSRHILRDLAHPSLRPMKRWFDQLEVDFNPDLSIDLGEIKPFIRADAF
ncbi:MAG TPA: phosphotransferase [Alphaproteobacteria bacterium]|nr:phosphotransferase [Alphaproteobacteria bacterium]HOO50025.1 phosphotransferase [Alphaproteobacteria bacterium]